MTLRAVIFDRDGVLTRFDFAPVEAIFAATPRVSLEALWHRWHAYYAETPLPRSLEEEHGYLGGFWDLVCAEWSLGESTRERLRRFDYVQTIRPFPDAQPALRAIRARGLRVGVLSNFPLVSLQASLVAAGLSQHVDVARAASIAGAPKPHPAAYLDVLGELGVAPAECALIDDEAECVEGARAVGVEAYLLRREGAGPPEPGVVGDLTQFVQELDGLVRGTSRGSM